MSADDEWQLILAALRQAAERERADYQRWLRHGGPAVGIVSADPEWNAALAAMEADAAANRERARQRLRHGFAQPLPARIASGAAAGFVAVGGGAGLYQAYGVQEASGAVSGVRIAAEHTSWRVGAITARRDLSRALSRPRIRVTGIAPRGTGYQVG